MVFVFLFLTYFVYHAPKAVGPKNGVTIALSFYFPGSNQNYLLKI